ncbi:DUF4863 family protein [Paraburkholderia sp. DGU8]|uniref:4-hydroxylaminobenzoate lyase n=1 Tax=Paraburkholderia sp. DGU8 TaxID=3161997 RepID=UPI00346666F7
MRREHAGVRATDEAPSNETSNMSFESGLLRDVKRQYHSHTNGQINMIVPFEGSCCGLRRERESDKDYALVRLRAVRDTADFPASSHCWITR